jgi:predicted Ser/Thr protein kinase
VHFENVKSFQDRIITTNIPYILDYNTEVEIYQNKFGKKLEAWFLPRVLNNFAKIIISSRMNTLSPSIEKWLAKPEIYKKYQDKNFLLLKMDIYTGKIPDWLTEEDLKRFTREIRKNVLSESETEGKMGFSGRQSLTVFNNFLLKNAKQETLYTMDMITEYFEKTPELKNQIPEGFIESIVHLYDYNVLQEVKEAVYYYNEKQISKDILNYIFAVNFDPGITVKCEYTGDVLEIDEDYFKNIEAIFLGTTSTLKERKSYRDDVQTEYITTTLSQEIKVKGKDITKTELYNNLFQKYTKNLKENALAPYNDNKNFRNAILDYDSSSFKKYDSRLRRDVSLLITNLQAKFGYDKNGAIQLSIYVLDKDLAKKY